MMYRRKWNIVFFLISLHCCLSLVASDKSNDNDSDYGARSESASPVSDTVASSEGKQLSRLLSKVTTELESSEAKLWKDRYEQEKQQRKIDSLVEQTDQYQNADPLLNERAFITKMEELEREKLFQAYFDEKRQDTDLTLNQYAFYFKTSYDQIVDHAQKLFEHLIVCENNLQQLAESYDKKLSLLIAQRQMSSSPLVNQEITSLQNQKKYLMLYRQRLHDMKVKAEFILNEAQKGIDEENLHAYIKDSFV